MRNVFIYLIKSIAVLYFFIFIVAAMDITLAILNGKAESLVLGFTADLFSLILSLIVIVALSFIISIPVKPKNPTN